MAASARRALGILCKKVKIFYRLYQDLNLESPDP